ncbi:hypothetical protein NDU88_003988 [Pleurodeles waltl]|uniref:Uncharacterized protein n=1 Tax=Pleurodeles waltl TaxID=8319 RepID=A0AAV7WU94_PLEWA|nr:hypothetical protein NDU88_003988 [Pleurodeles waltl]
MMDCRSQRVDTKSVMTGGNREVMQGPGLQDVWKERNPECTYLCFTPASGMHSRLDYCLISGNLVHDVVTISFLALYLSDHSSLLFFYKTSRRASRAANVEAWVDLVFAHTVSEVLENYFEENWESTNTRATEWDAMKVAQGKYMKMTYGVKMQLTRMLDVQAK